MDALVLKILDFHETQNVFSDYLVWRSRALWDICAELLVNPSHHGGRYAEAAGKEKTCLCFRPWIDGRRAGMLRESNSQGSGTQNLPHIKAGEVRNPSYMSLVNIQG